MSVEIKEIRVDSILNRSKIADYCINPYVGCQHACKYCYASYYTERIYKTGKSWGSYVYIKSNAVEILRKEIFKRKIGSVFLSSLTDPYQPIEKKYKITRNILNLLSNFSWSVIIQSKSSLVLRDLDIISRLKNVRVGITLISLNKDVVKKFEPFSSSIDDRIKVLKELKESKIKNYLFIGPIMPFTEFQDISELIFYTKNFVDFYYFDKLNIRPNLIGLLKEEFSTDNKTFDMKEYYLELKDKLKEICIKNKINFEILF